MRSLLLAASLLLLMQCRRAPAERSFGPDATTAPGAVAALGRIEPDELVALAGPSRTSVVVEEILVEEGDEVEAGQVVAILDSLEVEAARVAAWKAELEHAQVELDRAQRLIRGDLSSRSAYDETVKRRDLARARLSEAEAEQSRSQVRSPFAGRVLAIHARAGERVGSEGIVEIADLEPMLVVAEVYETDVGRLRVGQSARVTSPALGSPVAGTVRRVGEKVGRRDVLDSDPVADVDSRVVEVEVELEPFEAARFLTHLRVDVVIDTAGAEAPTSGDD